MRPLSLRIKGFTSFRDEQVVEFSDLDLFALWGPTGSGKSSVLDAITYALFGQVERVGNRAGQLVSQGQPRMAVTLDFVAGEDTYRVTRSTPASGQTRARFEVLVGDEFVSKDEHADQVRRVNELVREKVGLDYEAFTRSVILPQGKFAEFLIGEAKNRRRILTELLGLELFKRMAQRANEVSKEARINLEVKQGLLERDYAGAEEMAVTAARKEAKDAATLAKVLAKAETKVDSLCARWDDDGRRIEALAGCVEEMADLAEVFARHHDALIEIASSIAPLEAHVTAAEAHAEAAEKALGDARAALDQAVAQWGDVEELVRLRELALGVGKLGKELTAAERSLKAEAAKEAAAVDELGASREHLAKAGAELELATRDLAQRESAHERAHDEDRVGALVAGLGPGDPCPVCERPLDRLPEISVDALEAAKKSLVEARAARESAGRAVAAAEKDVAVAEAGLAAAREGVARCAAEVAKHRTEIESDAGALATALGEIVVEDAYALLTERIEGLKRLAAAAESATKARTDAANRLSERTRSLEGARAKSAETRAALAAIGLPPALKRAAKAAPKVALPDAWPKDAPEDARSLATLAGEFAAALEAAAARIEKERVAADAARAKLLDQAIAALPEGLDVEIDDLHDLAAGLHDAARLSSERAALAHKDVVDLEARLAAAASLRAEIAAHKAERDVYKALGAELKDDNIVEFLQEEALQVLAGAATGHLHDLSSGRYELDFDDGDFIVVDAWNGDERRSVSTLSGGETFLASLSLALALAEQIQLLAVGDRNKLDSLFLDEGFGTLDAETLEVVVAAIEQLGGGDRLVGVITHVPELAERLPVRLEVTKSPRGSVISRRVGDLSLVPG